jgi:hypothetical protein
MHHLFGTKMVHMVLQCQKASEIRKKSGANAVQAETLIQRLFWGIERNRAPYYRKMWCREKPYRIDVSGSCTVCSHFFRVIRGKKYSI